jgi:pimeloyl-ACP methyl ester carboxylesterase
LPSTLARCGYVVVVPNHNPGILASPADVQAAMRDVDWVRNQWSGADWIDKRSTSITVAGHSNGALVAAAVAAAHPEIGAFVSLGGHHPNPPDNFEVLLTVSVPSFYMWTKTNQLEDLDGLWEGLPASKYAAVYEGQHFDYLSESDISGVPRGPCPHIPGVAADLAALFVSSNVASLTQIPIGLTKPQVQLTPEQAIYAGGNLASLDQINTHPGCRVDLRWKVSGVTGSRRLGPP